MRAPDVRRRMMAGFTLLELLIALFFTGILMAGLAKIFRGSFTTFVTANEGLSALRKNRMALDLLQDDLNQTGMYLAQLSSPPGGLGALNEPFRVDPNVTTEPTSGRRSDHLYLFWDEPLPFEPVLTVGAGGGAIVEANRQVKDGSQYQDQQTVQLDCRDAVLAQRMVEMVNRNGGSPKLLHRGDIGHPMGIRVGSASASGTVVTFSTESKDWTPLGATGEALFVESAPKAGDPYLVVNGRQQFRYGIQTRTVAPGQTAPCLVREQGTYSAGGFTADATLTTVVTEFVERFKVYLSVDNGATWVGLNDAAANWAALKADLGAQLAASGRSGAGTDMTNIHWYREIPTLLRVDVTTRTPTKRAEYGGTGFQTKTQSLLVMPRHFGLPY